MDPRNARGDGSQETGGSSSGSGSAVTAYGWLNFTIGSNTGGSARFPSRFGGLYGWKPTHGIFNSTGTLVAIAEQDTSGIMARSPSVFVKVGLWWANKTVLATVPSEFPKTLMF
jgi:Asp-tRNA(Asn)/Glu-tRNA(Gln) amidotransferase A subunit family amidase